MLHKATGLEHPQAPVLFEEIKIKFYTAIHSTCSFEVDYQIYVCPIVQVSDMMIVVTKLLSKQS